MGALKESSGSCLFNLGETKVIAWIHGPCETKSKCPKNSGLTFFKYISYNIIRKKYSKC